MSHPRTGRITQLARGIGLVLKMIKGLLLVGIVFPHARPHERDVIIERWCREVLDVLSVCVILEGEPPPARVSSVLFVANHVSWMDILILNASRRMRFVAKAEVRRWPLVGWLAARTGTIFLKRASPRELARVTGSVSRALRRGQCVALFPEGTTTDGTSMRPFHSGLFEAPIMAEAFVWPIAIQYQRPDGGLDASVAFVGNQSLMSSIVAILARPTIQARLSFASPVKSSASDRRALTACCQQAIEQRLAGSLPITVPAQSTLRYPSDERVHPSPPLTYQLLQRIDPAVTKTCIVPRYPGCNTVHTMAHTIPSHRETDLPQPDPDAVGGNGDRVGHAELRSELTRQRAVLLTSSSLSLTADREPTACADLADQASTDFEQDLVMQVKSRTFDKVRRIEQALQLIRTNGYGRCRRCHEEIPHERLKVQPDALFCVPCLTVVERVSGK